MRLVWFILAALAFGGLAWFMLNYGPMAGRGVPGWDRLTGGAPREPTIAPPGSLSVTPRYAAPMLVIEKSALDARNAGADLSNAAAFALPGVSLGSSVGGGEVKRRTLRIWSVQETGRNADFVLSSILRPPLGDAKVASLTATALSHDRAMAASGTIRLDGGFPVYVFDRVNGRILATLSGLTSPATAIAFSRDGRYIAVGLTKGGLRFYRTTDWVWVGQDALYDDLVRAIDFDTMGRVATTSLDGHVRIYDPSFRTVKKAKALQGSLPFDVAFSPDGAQLAVGYYDKAAISILDSESLAETRVLAPPRETTPAEWLTDTVWSKDGRWIFASGGFQSEDGRYPILRWATGDANAPAQALTALQFRVQASDLTAFGVNGVAAFAQIIDPDDPDESQGIEFGALDGGGAIAARKTGEASGLAPGIMAEDSQAFRVNADGTIIELPGLGDKLLRIDMVLRRTSAATSSTLDFAAPRQTHPDAALSDWRGANQPKLTGGILRRTKDLKLDTDERALSYAFAPEDSFLVIGTNHALRKYSFRGSLLQTVPAPSPIQRVTITPNGKLIVAAFKDGTVRWYDTARGEELLAIYVADDPQKWVAWTPSGFYDAGPGADSLIGWQVNRRGEEEPLFYPAGTFANVFYRPGLAVQVLRDGLSPPAPPADVLLARLPPVVTIFDVREASRQVVIEFKVESPANRPVTQLIAVIDGVKMPVDLTDETGVTIKPLALDRRLSLTFPLPDGSDTVRNATLSAGYDGETLGVASARGFAVTASSVVPGARKKARMLALVVGVSDYSDAGIRDLRFAANDAREVARRLRNQMSKFYAVVDVRELTEENATRSAILSALNELQAKATPDDVVLVFLAGHGVPDPNQPEASSGRSYYFISQDADATGKRLATTAVPYTEIVRLVTNAPGRRMVFLDTCYAGLVSDPDINGFVNAWGSKGVYVAAATSGTALAFEDEAWQHGAMTAALLKAFDGRAANVTPPGDTGITTELLKPFLREEIQRLTNGCQDPQILDLNLDRFAFAAIDPSSGLNDNDPVPSSRVTCTSP